jgi:transposase
VAYGAPEPGAAVTSLGTMGPRQGDSEPLLRTRPAKAPPRSVVSEAGPCGSWLSRYLRPQADDGWVVAPSLMPNKAGDRVKTDRRDARHLARLVRAGARTTVSGPQGPAEAMRALPRARADAIRDGTDAPCRLTALLLRHDSRSTGLANGGPAHLRWPSEVVWPTPPQPSVFHESVRAVQEHTARLQRLEPARHEHVPAWRVSPVVEALQAWRGVPCTVAVTLGAAMGALPRCETPRARMQFLGLVPAAYAAGEQRRQGTLTTAGPTQARRVLVAGAWASRSPAPGSRHVPLRRDTPSNIIQDIRGQAPVRRCQRYRRRVARGKHAPVVPVAMARELAGCMGAMAREGPITP